jgi:hypothetical protein
MNLELWNKVSAVPETAKKTITGGRLNGKTDINPVWRIKTLTEQFGVCGVGWKYVITSKHLEFGANNEIAAFVDIELYIRQGDKWSDAIPGTGGSMFVANEKNGAYTSDEAYKMALTDALSVACKALGMGASVYWDKGESKYTKPEAPAAEPKQAAPVQADLNKTTISRGEVFLPNVQYRVEKVEEAKDKNNKPFKRILIRESEFALTILDFYNHAIKEGDFLMMKTMTPIESRDYKGKTYYSTIATIDLANSLSQQSFVDDNTPLPFD